MTRDRFLRVLDVVCFFTWVLIMALTYVSEGFALQRAALNTTLVLVPAGFAYAFYELAVREGLGSLTRGTLWLGFWLAVALTLWAIVTVGY